MIHLFLYGNLKNGGERRTRTYLSWPYISPMVIGWLNFYLWIIMLDFFIGYCMLPLINPYESNQLPIPRFERMNIDSLFIYSDLVEYSVRVDDALTNLLAIVSVNKNRLICQILYIYLDPYHTNIFSRCLLG